jgi:gamma-glutamylcyclotransferase (GGCT)/AIG2-like uncharacterized protein YtfP
MQTGPPPAKDHLAVYGSLMTSEGMLGQLGVEALVISLGPAILPGQLFDLGDFPGLIAGEGSVPGELLMVLDPTVITRLDEYEACHPDSPETSLFIRKRLRLIEPAVDAWVYLYNRSVEDRPIISGISWPKYKASRKT